MPNEAQIPDAEARARALDPQRSFIVQAPAGSGKTELLTQRFLALLGSVHEPEEILALTFTRKAVGEMRGRIIDALRLASTDPMPEAAHARKTWSLARKALIHGEDRQWNLLQNPNRLKIQTIDALSSSLMRRLPWLSRSGALPEIAEDAEQLYERAAYEAFREVEGKEPLASSAAWVLDHMDNRLDRAVNLVAGLLAKRDQWLRHLGPGASREDIEEGIRNLVNDHLNLLDRLLSSGHKEELKSILRFAASNLPPDAKARALVAGSEAVGDTLPDRLIRWRAYALLLLTQKNEFRRRFDRNLGFPAQSEGANAAEKATLKNWKDRAQELAADLGNIRQFADEVPAVRMLPDLQLGDEDWDLIRATRAVLLRAAGHLRVVFQEEGAVDYTEIALRAQEALGTSDSPTDLALVLDARISHILVDEFQDTSVAQYDLVESLVAGWEDGDGRTLFVVGDPMQSIYRFREADVGRYLEARRRGIATVRFEVLRLEANFRSLPALVDWTNAAFPEIMPEEEDALHGAVPFAPSVAARSAESVENSPGVEVHPFISDSHEPEAERVLDLLRGIRARDPGDSVAILVRSRTHLGAILPALRRAEISFQAVDLEPLAENMAVKDLHSLTRAVLDDADRVAWMSVLRAPWCGMKLVDLEALVAGDRDATVVELLRRAMSSKALSPDALCRGNRVLEVFDRACGWRGSRPLRDIVEGIWLALGGPACVEAEADLENAGVYLDLLASHSRSTALGNLAGVRRAMTRLFARPDSSTGTSLQIMSIHRAKGLEFDHVILPGMNRKPNSDDNPLLAWLERPRLEARGRDLLMAPIGSDRMGNLLYEYLQHSEKRSVAHEVARLLYVAVTRAKKKLYLLGSAGRRDDGELRVTSGSLLQLLWGTLQEEYEARAEIRDEATAGASEGGSASAKLRRLASGWSAPDVERALIVPAVEGDIKEEVIAAPSYSWAKEMARHIGTVVHEILHRIAKDGLNAWTPERVTGLARWIAGRLIGLGVARESMDEAVLRVQRAVKATLEDERGQWILSPSHEDASSELALSGYDAGALRRIVIDRTFIDGQGRRWIIDYKTSVHEGSGLEHFLEAEQARYRPQLERYARMIARRNSMRDAGGDPVIPAVHLGLYFPLLRSWKEWVLEDDE